MDIGEIDSVFFCQYMCEIAECNGVQILNVVQFLWIVPLLYLTL